MICETCHGNGLVGAMLIAAAPRRITVPCPDCLGFGIVHCCEGEQEQPECLALPKPESNEETTAS